MPLIESRVSFTRYVNAWNRCLELILFVSSAFSLLFKLEMFAFASASALRRSKTLLTSSLSWSTTLGVDGDGIEATVFSVETTSDTTGCATDRMTRSALSGGGDFAASGVALLLLISIPSPFHTLHAFCIKTVAPAVMATTTSVGNPCTPEPPEETNAAVPAPAHTATVARNIATLDITNATAAPTADTPVPTVPVINAPAPESISINPCITPCGARILFNKIHAHSAVSNAPSITNRKLLITFVLTISHPFCTGAKCGNAIDKSLLAINDTNTIADARVNIDLYGFGMF